MKIQFELTDSHGIRNICEMNMFKKCTNIDVYKALKNWVKKLNSNAMDATTLMPNFYYSELVVIFDKKIREEKEFIISENNRLWDYSQSYSISYMDGDKKYSARCFVRMIEGSV